MLVDVRSWKGGGVMHEEIKAEISITRAEQQMVRRSGTPELEAVCTAHLDELLEEYGPVCSGLTRTPARTADGAT